MSDEFANRVVDECESTNDLARRLGEAGFPHGTWVSARAQTRGRGRLGREWKAQVGNLYLSIVVRLPEQRDWMWVPLAAGLACAETLVARFPELPVRVKWPNDLWVGGAKLGGLLCEAVGSRSQSFIVVGIGLNCASSPAGLDQPTASLTDARRAATPGAPAVSADDVRAEIVAAVTAAIDGLRADRSATVAALQARYARLAALPPGTEIEWGDGAEHARVLGLGEHGELRVLRADGREDRLYAEDVRVRRIRAIPRAGDGSPA